MKALTLWNPWAMLAALNLKEFETRSWATSYRGPLAIHAAKTFPKQARAMCFMDKFIQPLYRERLVELNGRNRINMPFGAIVALCILEEIYYITDCDIRAPYYCDGILKHKVIPLPPEPERSFGDFSPGRFAWKFSNIIRLPEPIVTPGKQSLWNLPRLFVMQSRDESADGSAICTAVGDKETGKIYVLDARLERASA